MKSLERTLCAFFIATLLSLAINFDAFGQGGTWTLKAPIPTPRHGTSTALAADGRIYVSGGYNGGTTPVNDAYDPSIDSWATPAGR